MREGNAVKKRSIKDFAIKSRRDWVIFWAFAVLAAYVLGNRYNGSINDWLRGIGNPWLTNLNEPQNYGRTIAACILLAVLAEIVLFLCRRKIWMKLAALAAGLVLPLAVVGVYWLHCRLIVSVLWEETPSSVSVNGGDGFEVWKSGGENRVPAEQWQELLEFCRNLTIVTDPEKQEECMAWYSGAEDPFMSEDYYVSLIFPQKYGHGYDFSLRIKDGYLYLWRGYKYREQTQLITFFEDNGIVEWLQGDA